MTHSGMILKMMFEKMTLASAVISTLLALIGLGILSAGVGLLAMTMGFWK